MKNLTLQLKRLSGPRILYPAMLGVYALTVLVLFVFVARFLTSELSQVLGVDTQEPEFSINREHYALVARKFGLPPLPSMKPGDAEAEAVSAAELESAPLDRAMLSIAVYNGTETAGLAARTKETLERAGFTVAKVGNESATSTSTLEIKESKRAYVPLLQEALTPRVLEITTLPETASFDCLLTLGD